MAKLHTKKQTEEKEADAPADGFNHTPMAEHPEVLNPGGVTQEFHEAEEAAAVRPAAATKQTGREYGPGIVTCRSKSFHGNQEISQAIRLPEAQTEEAVWNAFVTHHPSALRPDFTIDTENTTDPALRTDKE